MQKTRVLLLAPALLLAACSADRIPGVYRIDVQQGNVVDQEDVNQLEPGMTKRQVRYVLGTPLLVDTFHAERWDYYYSFQPGGEEREQRRVTLFFENDRLARLEGDVIPGQPAADGESGSSEPVVVPLEQREEKGFFGRMLEKVGIGDDD